MEKLCCFIDLLGFSSYVNADFNDAITLMNNYETIILTGKTISTDYSSFESFLPCSDSIFILSSKYDDFLQDISKFYLQCFNITSDHYLLLENDIDSLLGGTGVFIDSANNAIKYKKQLWYPTLFRGGISFGKMEDFTQKGIIAGEYYEQYNLAGEAVVRAVRLEENSGHGPRLFCDEYLLKELSKGIIDKYILTYDNKYEILWPIKYFNEQNDLELDIDNFIFHNLISAVNLWLVYRNTKPEITYFNLVKVMVLSVIQYSKQQGNEVLGKKKINDHIYKKIGNGAMGKLLSINGF
jgi:hypothetical protein